MAVYISHYVTYRVLLCCSRYISFSANKSKTEVQCWCPGFPRDKLPHSLHGTTEDEDSTNSPDIGGEILLNKNIRANLPCPIILQCETIFRLEWLLVWSLWSVLKHISKRLYILCQTQTHTSAVTALWHR